MGKKNLRWMCMCVSQETSAACEKKMEPVGSNTGSLVEPSSWSEVFLPGTHIGIKLRQVFKSSIDQDKRS